MYNLYFHCALMLIMVALVLAADTAQGVVFGKVVSLPHTKYVLERDYGILRCQNRSENGSVFYNYINNAQWYRLFPNETIYQFGNSGPVRVQSYGLYFQPFVRPEDQGMYYCCKPNGSCSEKSTVTIAVPPTIEVVESDYVSTVGSNVTLTCRITNHGRPVANFVWRRNGMRLSNDSTSINSTHFSLTLSNLTEVDGGIYRCAAQGVLSLPIENVNLIIKVHPEVTISGPAEANFGSNVSIRCTVLKGNPSPNVFIITPQGEVIKESVISINATMKDAGNYTCIANNSEGTITSNLTLTVYVAPQPVKSRQWITITAGADLILPCIIQMAYPPPLFHWQHIVPHDAEVAGNFQQLENGSLLLTGVKAPAIYKCMAWNEYGTSIQFIYITVDNQEITNTSMMFLITDPKSNCYHNRSEKYKTQVSAALEEYIQEICNCTVMLTNANLICINSTSAFYTVQLIDQNSIVSTFIYELLDIIIMNNGIDLGIAIIRTWTITEETTDNSDDSDKNASDWHPLLYSLLAILFILLISFISYNCYRYVKNRQIKDYETNRKASITSETALTKAVIFGNEAASLDITTNNATTV